MNKAKLETLVIARAFTTMDALSAATLAKTLRRFAPVHLAEPAWRMAVDTAIADLQQRGVLDARHRLRDRDVLARRIGRHNAKRWQQLAEHVLPALALEIAPDDAARHKRLAGRDEWSAAMTARGLGLWAAGPPPTLPALCDALAWRELGLSGKPKRCPAEIRACFVQRQLGSDAGSPERLVRVLAARLTDAPRQELRALRDALVRNWLQDRPLGRIASSDSPVGSPTPLFALEVLEVAQIVRDGVFGERKVFISSVWNELRHQPSWSELSLAEFKARLISAHRAGQLALVRADLVAAMDPSLVAASETVAEGAAFHFIVRDHR